MSRLFNFAGLPVQDSVKTWFNKSTHPAQTREKMRMEGHPAFYRVDDASVAVNRWWWKVRPWEIDITEHYCKHVMQLMGYTLVSCSTDEGESPIILTGLKHFFSLHFHNLYTSRPVIPANDWYQYSAIQWTLRSKEMVPKLNGAEDKIVRCTLSCGPYVKSDQAKNRDPHRKLNVYINVNNLLLQNKEILCTRQVRIIRYVTEDKGYLRETWKESESCIEWLVMWLA